HHGGTAVGVGDVGAHRHRRGAGGGDGVGGVLGVALVDLGDDHRAALGGQRLGVGPAEPLAGAGDDGDLPVEAAHQPTPPRSSRNALYLGKAGRMAGSSFMILLMGPVTFTLPLARARAMLRFPSQKSWPSSAAMAREISVSAAGSGFMVPTGGSTVAST